MLRPVLFCLLLVACNTPSQPEHSVESILQADRDFSALSETEGMRTAFLTYAASEGVLLRPGRMPIVGKQAIADLLEGVPDTAFTLTWEPVFGKLAVSGELGYTYGIYTYQQDSITEKGTYVSIWERDADGNWKYLLDTGNSGIGD